MGPASEASLSDLARDLGADVGTVQREVARLEEAGILKTRRVGRARLASLDSDSPYFQPLADLVALAFGPRYILEQELAEVNRIDEAFIFGSWAARFIGREGAQPADVDLLVVGSPDRDDLYEAVSRAEARLKRPVNVTVKKARTWRESQDAFLQQVRSSPLLPLRMIDR